MKTFQLKIALEELETIEKAFQQPELDLEQALIQHKRATSLARDILAYLDSAETVLETLSITPSLEEAEEI